MPRGVSRNYINFLPAYLTELDTLMEKQGYHVSRHNPAAATVDLTASANGTLHPKRPGNITLETRNTGKEPAHNLALKLTFSTAPSIVEGSGWICEAVSPLVWNCRRGGLAECAREIRKAGLISPSHKRQTRDFLGVGHGCCGVLC